MEDIAKFPLFSGIIELYLGYFLRTLFLALGDVRSPVSEASGCKAERHFVCLLRRLLKFLCSMLASALPTSFMTNSNGIYQRRAKR